jgi:hypothetical protein
VSPLTLTAPPTDRSMWRKLLRLAHPETGGDGELFIWVRALYEHVAGSGIDDAHGAAYERRQPPPHHRADGARVGFGPNFAGADSFEALTSRALAYAERLGEPFAGLLWLLRDCRPAPPYDTALVRQERQGATYRSLARAAHAVGMSKQQRVPWYGVAEKIPLSQRHVGHIISELERRY